MNTNVAFRMLIPLYLALSGVVGKPTEFTGDGTLQEIEALAQRFESENEELKAKLELVESEQLKMEDLIEQFRDDSSFGLENPFTVTHVQEVQELQHITFTFPRQETTADWVKYMLPFPKMEDLTMCLWISPEDVQNAYVMSYATSSTYNHLSVQILDENTLRIWVSRSYAYDFEGFLFDFRKKVHLCINLSLYTDTLTVYENGAFKERKDITDYYGYTYDGGYLYFGQDQDSLNGGFSSAEAYKGEISDFIIWPRNLTALEVRGVATSCSHPKDYILRPQMTNIEWSGNVKVSIDDECLTTAVGTYEN